MLSQQLMEKALSLTGKTMEDMEWDVWKFSMPRFCYYLLSPEFIEQIMETQEIKYAPWYYMHRFWEAIYEYQLWNEEPLIALLSKI